MPAATNPTYVAGGTINPCRFVTMYSILSNGVTTPTAADFTVFQAGSGASNKGDMCIGVVQEGTDLWSSNSAATSGEQVRIFGPGEVALVECGGTVTAGAWVKSDANGRAIVCNTDEDFAVGFALQQGNAAAGNMKIQVYIHPTTYAVQ